ncbi:uncharacterized protein IL334_004332 [Kwoniella shivajii]|uniref:C2H2-type domain-containing protein n=1 Tax=Kwoniella shivajii TaxID=564305 RepID=A0ABZ1D018_9TREE|nr:hypothetical protein IL334_004332 [Kwoniella shivajii]
MSSKFACQFPDCTRTFDRYTRLQAHFMDHVSGTIKYRASGRSTHVSKRTGRSQKRKREKHRSSNLRSPHPISAPLSSPIIGSAIQTPVIDLRTPSLSPDTSSSSSTHSPSSSRMEVDIDEIDIPSTSLVPQDTPRKGPTWAVAPPSLSPSPVPSPSPSPSPSLSLSLSESTESHDSEIDHVNEDHDHIDPEDDTPHTTIPNDQYANPNPSQERVSADMEQLVDTRSSNGDTDTVEDQLGNPSTPSSIPITPPRKSIFACDINSPFRQLSSAAPKSNHSDNIPEETTFSTCTRHATPSLTRSVSTSDANEIIATPNSLDRFIEDARKVLGSEGRRRRSETPCPVSKQDMAKMMGFTEGSKNLLDSISNEVLNSHPFHFTLSDNMDKDLGQVSPSTDQTYMVTSGCTCHQSDTISKPSVNNVLAEIANHIMSCPSLLQTMSTVINPSLSGDKPSSATMRSFGGNDIGGDKMRHTKRLVKQILDLSEGVKGSQREEESRYEELRKIVAKLGRIWEF